MLGIFAFDHLLLLENAHMPHQDIALLTHVLLSPLKLKQQLNDPRWASLLFYIMQNDQNIVVLGHVLELCN